jgi:hypothetical protein
MAPAAQARQMPRRPSPVSDQLRPIPANAGLPGPSTSSCRSRSPYEITPSAFPYFWETLIRSVRLTNRHSRIPLRGIGARSLERRNQASQTIILDLSQCSLEPHLPAITRKIFPSNFRQKYRFPGCCGLTAELPVVGTGERPHRNLIRAGDGGLGGAEFAWELPSRRRHFRISPPAQATQASRGTDPDGAFEMHGQAG